MSGSTNQIICYENVGTCGINSLFAGETGVNGVPVRVIGGTGGLEISVPPA